MWVESSWQGEVGGQSCSTLPPTGKPGLQMESHGKQTQGRAMIQALCLRKKEREGREDQTLLPGFWGQQLAG